MRKFTDRINESVEDKIPTAEEWLLKHKTLSMYDVQSYDEGGYVGVEETALYIIMVEFAKFHVKRALKAASEQADMDDNYYASIQEGSYGFIDKDTILNAYPLDNIK